MTKCGDWGGSKVCPKLRDVTSCVDDLYWQESSCGKDFWNFIFPLPPLIVVAVVVAAVVVLVVVVVVVALLHLLLQWITAHQPCHVINQGATQRVLFSGQIFLFKTSMMSNKLKIIRNEGKSLNKTKVLVVFWKVGRARIWSCSFQNVV